MLAVIKQEKAKIAEKQAIKADLTEQDVLDNIAYGVRVCKERNNMTALARYVEMQGRYLAMFTENINSTDTQRQRELDAEEQAEASELARLRLASKYGLIVEKTPLKPGAVVEVDKDWRPAQEAKVG